MASDETKLTTPPPSPPGALLFPHRVVQDLHPLAVVRGHHREGGDALLDEGHDRVLVSREEVTGGGAHFTRHRLPCDAIHDVGGFHVRRGEVDEVIALLNEESTHDSRV